MIFRGSPRAVKWRPPGVPSSCRQPRASNVSGVPEPKATGLQVDESRRLSLTRLSLLALVVGLVTGPGAVGFRDLIGFVHNFAFAGRLSYRYDANVFTGAAPWGALVILVPVVGGILVTFLVSNFAPEAKGHGVPEVIGDRMRLRDRPLWVGLSSVGHKKIASGGISEPPVRSPWQGAGR